MASLSSALNVYNTCLLILRSKGYVLSFQKFENDAIWWRAKINEYDFLASNPIELLGLVAIYEFKQPSDVPKDYWWKVEGEFDELLEQFIELK